MPALGRPQVADRARFTSRAAVLAVVLCAIALSLAYPVREYIAQRRQIDQLQAERQLLTTQLRQLELQQGRLNDPTYIEQLARDKLHRDHRRIGHHRELPRLACCTDCQSRSYHGVRLAAVAWAPEWPDWPPTTT